MNSRIVWSSTPRVFAALLVLSAIFAAAPRSLLAQPTGGETVNGTVVDATTGAPVGGAFVSVAIPRGPRTIADPQGRFRLNNVPAGAQIFTAQRFGYQNLEVRVTVARNAPIQLRMVVDPVAVEGVTIGVERKRALGGTVLDASNGERLPWASVKLTADFVRSETVAKGDGEGVFLLGEVPPGMYQLHVELLGYEPTIIPVEIGARTEAVTVRLRPDRAMKEGLARLTRDLRNRRNSYPRLATAFDVTKLNYSAAPDALEFLGNETSTDISPCVSGNDRWCIGSRGNARPGKVFIDENAVGGLDMLRNYRPADFYSIEIYNQVCVFAYTYPFVQNRATRPRTFTGAEFMGC